MTASTPKRTITFDDVRREARAAVVEHPGRLNPMNERNNSCINWSPTDPEWRCIASETLHRLDLDLMKASMTTLKSITGSSVGETVPFVERVYDVEITDDAKFALAGLQTIFDEATKLNIPWASAAPIYDADQTKGTLKIFG